MEAGDDPSVLAHYRYNQAARQQQFLILAEKSPTYTAAHLFSYKIYMQQPFPAQDVSGSTRQSSEL